jgi:predicted anti-sigma-YlaC factor YlaD
MAEHDSIQALFSAYHDQTLADEDRGRVDRHLNECAACRAEYDSLRRTLNALSGLHKMAAPETFEGQVEQTIHRRSAGRFFGRKAFGDRVPFELLAAVALVVLVALYVVVRMSDTGAVRINPSPRSVPTVPDEARTAVPRP